MANVTAIKKVNSLEAKRLSEAIRTSWSKNIVFQALIADHMSNIPFLTSSIDPGGSKKVEMGKMIMDVTPSGSEKYARKVVLEKIMALQGTGLYGDNVENQPGNEENVRAKYFTAFAADWSHAICGDQYGFNYRDQKEQEIFDKSKGLLAQWWGETDGLFMRHAYTQSVSPNLLAQSAISGEIEAHYNDNIYICGAYKNEDTFITARDYDDYTDYETAVLAALALATEDSKLDVRKLMDIAEQCAESSITPVKWEGYDLYSISVHPDDMTHLVDPSIEGSFGKNWVTAAALGSGQLNSVLPGASFVAAESLVVIRDRRAPRFQLVSGGTGSDFKYLLQGNNDQRKNLIVTTEKVFNVHIVRGENNLVKFNPEPLHYEDQDENYRRHNNVGIFGACGYMIPIWRNDTSDASSSTESDIDAMNDSSMLVFTAAKNFSATSS